MDLKDAGFFALAAAMSWGAPGAPADASAAPGELRRAADWGFSLAPLAGAEGAEVRRLRQGSAAQRAGLRDGDRVLRIGSTALVDARSLARSRRSVRGGDRVELEVRRDGATRRVAFELTPLPLESIPGCRVEYGWVQSPRGYRVRTIVTRPADATGRLPAILFVPWLSESPVETPLGTARGTNRLLQELTPATGWMLMRVEKPGVGDSEGPPCGENDLEEDLDASRAALRALAARADVDPERIVLLGASIGGGLVPLLAVEQPVAGIMIAGTFTRTWFEHMMEIERRRLELEGTPPTRVNDAMRGFADFYSLYLGQRLTPAEVIARRPDLGALWYDAPDGQYGRPASYYHQVAALNLEDAWSRLDVPVLILWGEHDWIMSRTEHEHLAMLLNARHPGRATLEMVPGASHDFEFFASAVDAFRDRDPRPIPDLAARIAHWLDANLRAAP